jgi:hypothetical protein
MSVRTSPVIERVEPRRLMAVDIAFAGGDLTLTGDAGPNSVLVNTFQRPDGTAAAKRGTTSVFLDLPLLQSAANLTLTGASSTGTPASSAFQVGFPITSATDYTYRVSPFAPLGGEIEHTGTVTFNNAITVGNFSIGFDPARATNGRSGFFVRDTASNLGILFDVSAPQSATITARQFKVTGDLLVSPEFAALLQQLNLASANLTGADVGNALVAAKSAANLAPFVVVHADGADRSFPAADVDSIAINTLGGVDHVTVRSVDKPVSVNLGGGSDRLFVVNGRNQLDVVGGNGNDRITLIGGTFSKLTIDAGIGDDVLNTTATDLTGPATVTGGSGNDTLVSVSSDLKANNTSSFERLFVV